MESHRAGVRSRKKDSDCNVLEPTGWEAAKTRSDPTAIEMTVAPIYVTARHAVPTARIRTTPANSRTGGNMRRRNSYLRAQRHDVASLR